MDPYQQYPNQNLGNNAYNFILNPEQPKRFSLGNLSPAIIAAIIGGIVVLLLITGLIISALGSGDGIKDELIKLAQTQNELIRVAEQGALSATEQTTKNAAMTIALSATSQQQGIVALLSESGTKVKEEQLALTRNSTTDKTLSSAKTTSTFDSAFNTIIHKQLTDYAAELKQVYSHASGKKTRSAAHTYYTQTQLILSTLR